MRSDPRSSFFILEIDYLVKLDDAVKNRTIASELHMHIDDVPFGERVIRLLEYTPLDMRGLFGEVQTEGLI